MGVPKSHEMTAPLVTLFGSCLHLVVRKQIYVIAASMSSVFCRRFLNSRELTRDLTVPTLTHLGEREGNHRVSIIMFMHTPSSHEVVCVATALAPVAVLPPPWVSSRDPFAPAAELVYACKHIYTNSRVL
jgi:hypothetical protein